MKKKCKFEDFAHRNELIQTIGVVITVCITIIIALNWFLDVRVKVKVIPTLTSIVINNMQAIRTLSLELQNLKDQLKLQEKIKKQEQEIRSLREELKRLKTLYVPNEKRER